MKRNSAWKWQGAVLALLLLFSLAVAVPPAEAFLFSSYRTETQTYTPPGWPAALQGDLYVPKSKKKAPYPVVVLIHGGAWHMGDKESMKKTGKLLADRGYAAFAVNYRLAPQFHYPAPVEDVQEALRWLQAHAPQYRLDMNRVAVWGYSAGAHLAALLAVQPITTDVPEVKVVIAGGTPADLRNTDAPQVRDFLGASRADATAVYEDASPAARIRPGLPAFLLYYGSADTLVSPSQSENFAKALKEAEVPVQVLRLDGYDHKGTALALKRYLPAVLAFLDKHFAAAANRSAGAR